MEERYLLLEKEWDYVKNEKKFSECTKGCHYKAWWTHICKCGEKHEWQQVFKSRVAGRNCPYCANVPKKLCKCKSLEYLYPEVAKEWHPTKNIKKPNEVFSQGSLKAWWLCNKSKCEHKHEWQAGIHERTSLGQGCPKCSNRSICICYSLYMLFPEIAKEWHPTKNKILENKGVNIKNVTAKSNKNIWWLCPKGHEWQSNIADRTRKDNRQLVCKICNHNISYGEREITKLLNNLKIDYKTQYYIKAEGIGLKIDFYLTEYNKAIEFDGDLHFRNTEFFGGIKKFERTKYLDILKTQYCANNNIHLLRIYWKDVDDIEILIKDFIHNNIGTTWYSKNYPI